MEVAMRSNHAVRAEKYNVPMAEAKVSQARTGTDPYVSMGNVSHDLSGQNMPSQWYVGVSKNIDIGNKRRSRGKSGNCRNGSN